MDFTSRQLRAFHLVAHHRSFARAAEALFITPSGLSVLIRELERQLGFRLFDRTTRKVGLTPQGSDLLAITQPGLRALDTAMLRIKQVTTGRNKHISIGATPWIAANVLPEAIRQFREHRSDLRVRLFDGGLGGIVRRVQAGKLDFGLGIFTRGPGVRRVPFFRFSLMVIRPSAGTVPNRPATRWSALGGQTLVSLTSNYPHQQLIDRQLRKMGVVCNRAQTVNLLDTQIGLVEAGEGIAIIPSFGMLACRNRKVTVSQLIDPIVNLELYQISNRGRTLPAEAKEFSAFLKMYLASWVGESGVL
jgi:LysR family transcriptional regulator, carnitine catabolism transcriptional activator